MESLITFSIALLTLVNPLGTATVYIGLTQGYTQEQHRKTAWQTFFVVLAMMLVMTWVGNYILMFFGISPDSLKVAGAVIIGYLGFGMLQNQESEMKYSESKQEDVSLHNSIAIVPLSFPMIVGPGSISTLITASVAVPGVLNRVYISIICLIISVSLLLSLLFSSHIGKMLGQSGLSITSKIMGMLLMSIAAEMFASGLVKLLPGLG